MQDFFAVLEEERRPWIDVEKLQQKFVRLSALVHPDRVHELSVQEKEKATESFSTLNAAYQGLRDAKSRVSHLIQLQRGTPPKTIQAIPDATAKLFMEMAEFCQRLDGFLSERAKVESPMMKVQMFERGLDLSEQIKRAQETLNHRRNQLMEKLKEADSRWRSGDSVEELERIYHEFSYLDRWAGQLQERLGKIMA